MIKHTICPKCNSDDWEYNEIYDAKYCFPCNIWLEKKCCDEQCEYCSHRPETPKEVIMKWISVKEKYPMFGSCNHFLFFNGKKEVTCGYAFSENDERSVWISDAINETNEIATHWMQLPDPPKEII